jgi:hypothetical protein
MLGPLHRTSIDAPACDASSARAIYNRLSGLSGAAAWRDAMAELLARRDDAGLSRLAPQVALLMKAHAMAAPLVETGDTDAFCRFFNKIAFCACNDRAPALEGLVGTAVQDIAAVCGRLERDVEATLSCFGYQTAEGMVTGHSRPWRFFAD